MSELPLTMPLARSPVPAAALDALRRLEEAHRIGAVDAAFGRWIGEHDAPRAEPLAIAAALVSAARAAGHSGLPLADTGDDAVLLASPLVGEPGAMRPLIVDGGRLYLHRFWAGEKRIAERISMRLAPAETGGALSEEVKGMFARLFPPGAEAPDWQAVSAAAALRSRLLLIAGGPGTGKTTTVVRLLALLLSAEPDLRIALAAPTGKAANRIGASIEAQLGDARIPPAVRKRIPREAATLHRLLGYRPSSARFTRTANNPIPADVVLVDEASMIDLLLFDALLAAVPDGARLILLGDPHQLASVEAGFVFGDLCRAGARAGRSEAFDRHLAALGISELPATAAAPAPLGDVVVTLRKSYRFTAASGIGRLATAIRAGDAASAVEILGDARFPDIEILPPAALEHMITERLGPYVRRMCTAASPEEAIRYIEDVRLLAATRWGPRGVNTLNARVEEWLLAEGLRRPRAEYRGRAILVTTNDYEVDLFNGDLGVLWPQANPPGAYFPAPEGVRHVAAHRLPAHESAWAVTVHKSQGSEFDDVILVLPAEPIELLTRELLYTAVTRARRRVTIIGDPAVLRAAVARPEQRFTGLAERLG